jgi:hypothetical protein
LAGESNYSMAHTYNGQHSQTWTYIQVRGEIQTREPIIRGVEDIGPRSRQSLTANTETSI